MNIETWKPKKQPPAPKRALERKPPWDRIEVVYCPHNWPKPYCASVYGIERTVGVMRTDARTPELAVQYAILQVRQRLRKNKKKE